MKLILLESYEADLSNSGYNIQFGEELTEIQTNLYSVCKHSDTFLAHCIFQSPTQQAFPITLEILYYEKDRETVLFVISLLKSLTQTIANPQK